MKNHSAYIKIQNSMLPWLSRCILFLFVFFASCTILPPSNQTASGGTGSEIVGNAAQDSSDLQKVLVLHKSSKSTFIPVPHANVFCYQRSFVPDTNWASSAAQPRVQANSDGSFIIEDAPPGEVVVEVNDGKGNSFVKTTTVDKDSASYSVGTLVVKQGGSISIQALTQLSGKIRFYVGIKGTHLVVRGSQTGIDIKLDNIPTGISHTVSIRVYEPIYFAKDISNITVSSSVNTVLDAFQIK